jgi:hypothetical protein
MSALRIVVVTLGCAAIAAADEPELSSQPIIGSGTVPAPAASVDDKGDHVEQRARLDEAGADEDVFADVVLVGGDESYFCTGVVVDRLHVLTAAHCAHGTRVGFGADARTSTAVRVAARRVHPRLDVAVLTLARPAHVDLHARRSHADREPPLGAIRIMGFGVRDRMRLTGFGTKRMVDVGVDGWGCTPARATATGCRPGDEMIVRGGDGNDTCLGDSGGPVFELADRRWRLLAITSRGMRPRKVICGEGGIYMRIDRISEWLEEVTK